jgi:hypothetical protein
VAILSSVADSDPLLRMFLGLLDPDTDPLGKGTDPDPQGKGTDSDPFTIQSSLQWLSLNNVSAQLM